MAAGQAAGNPAADTGLAVAAVDRPAAAEAGNSEREAADRVAVDRQVAAVAAGVVDNHCKPAGPVPRVGHNSGRNEPPPQGMFHSSYNSFYSPQ